MFFFCSGTSAWPFWQWKELHRVYPGSHPISINKDQKGFDLLWFWLKASRKVNIISSHWDSLHWDCNSLKTHMCIYIQMYCVYVNVFGGNASCFMRTSYCVSIMCSWDTMWLISILPENFMFYTLNLNWFKIKSLTFF